jgi:hypothetical protein
MALGTVLSGVFLFVSTLASTSEAVVGREFLRCYFLPRTMLIRVVNCAVTIIINFFFAVQV